MSLLIRNTADLIRPEAFRWKTLIYGSPGVGKSTWVTTAPNVGVAACETGHGNGLLSAADRNVDFVEPTCMADMEALAAGRIFADKDTIVVDSASAMARGFVKDAALAIPRRGALSPKRAAGVPELDDYGTMGELMRRLLARLLDLDKHIIVTAGLRAEKEEDAAGNLTIKGIGPDFPGQLFLGVAAMFDTVLCMKSRSLLRNPADKKSQYNQRFFITENDGFHVAKCRSVKDNRSLLAPEEIFELDGRGSWPDLYAKIRTGYAKQPV